MNGREDHFLYIDANITKKGSLKMDNLRTPNIKRLVSALRREKYDRVPNMEISFDPLAAANILGLPERMAFRSDDLDAQTQVKLAMKTCEDAVVCNLHCWLAPWGSITDREAFQKAMEKPFSTAYVKEKIESFTQATEGTRIGTCVMLAGPFFTTYFTIGPIPIQSCMYMLYDDIELVEDIMDAQLNRQIEIVKALRGEKVDYVEIADDLCDNMGTMINPDMLKKLWLPRMAKLVEAVKTYLGVPVQSHCCGKLDQVLPWFVELGVDAITPIQTNCNDIYGIKEKYGDKFCLVGNMCIEGALAFGTPEEVEAETKERIERLSYDGGYVVASSHSICDVITPENYYAMMEAAIKYGKYK